jgi:hypothetical protein
MEKRAEAQRTAPGAAGRKGLNSEQSAVRKRLGLRLGLGSPPGDRAYMLKRHYSMATASRRRRQDQNGTLPLWGLQQRGGQGKALGSSERVRARARAGGTPRSRHWPCLDTLAGLELELVSNSSSSPKLTLALEVFG